MVERTSGVADQFTRVALVARALTAALPLPEVVDIVVRQGMAGLGAEGGVLALLEPGGVIAPVATVGYPQDRIDAFAPMTVDQELPLTVAVREREAVWVPSRAEAAARFPALVAGAGPASQAWAAIPLVAEGSVLGVLGVSFEAPREFSELERIFVTALGAQCALALAARRASPAPDGGVVAPGAPGQHRPARAAGAPVRTLVIRPPHGRDVGVVLAQDPRFSVAECADADALLALECDEDVDVVVVAGDLDTARRPEILRTVRARCPGVVAVVLTSDPDVEERARRLGADAVFGMGVPAGWLRGALVALVEGGPPGRVEAAGAPGPVTGGTGSLDERSLSASMFEQSLDAVLFTAPDGRILAANPAACGMLGMSEGEIRRRGRRGLADPGDPRWAAGVAEREATGRFFGELSFLRADGTAFPAEVSSAVFEDEVGERRTVVVIRDLTERGQELQELRRLALSDETHRARVAGALLEVAFRRLGRLGMSLHVALEGPPSLLAERARAAIDEIDDTLGELRSTLWIDVGDES